MAAVCYLVASVLFILGVFRMSVATDALTAAVAANTTATNDAIAKIGALPDTQADAAVLAAVTQIETNTRAITDALTPAAPVAPAA